MAFFRFKSNIFRLMVLNARNFVLFFNLLKTFRKKQQLVKVIRGNKGMDYMPLKERDKRLAFGARRIYSS